MKIKVFKFDIDKLYVSRYQYDKKGNKIAFDESKGMEGNSEDAIKNKLVEQYLKVLTTLEYTNQLKVSIDNATDTVKSVLKKIESKKSVHHQTPFQVYSPKYQEEVKSEYTKGKSGIGPFALNNAHHILTQLMGVKFKSNEFTEALNLIDLDKQYDDDGSGRRILDWLSAMINAFVDIAKDPYIVRLNVNPYTFNMTAYLLRMGKGEQTFYFLKQPVIDAVAKAVLNTRGNYGKDNTKTLFEVEKEATQKVLDSFGITESVLEAQREILKDSNRLAIHLESLFNGELEKMLLSDDISQEDKNKYQAKVWLAWQAMTPYAKDMADLVKYSKVDTKKMGKSFAAQRIFENGIDRIKHESETRFKYGVLDNFFNNTFLTTKAKNSIAFGRSLFENQLLRTTPKFVSTLDNILYRLGKSKSVDERLLRAIVGSMEAAIKSEYFNQKMKDKGIIPADFFYGDNTIARRLMKLRNRIYRGELNDLKNNVVGFNNALLNFLIPNTVKYETTFTEPDYVDVKTMFDQDVHSKNMIITAWEELLQHYDEEVRTLAEDLIYYSFLTSGDNKNMNSFFEFVPTSWRKEYSQFLQDKLDNNETSVNYRDIYLNNWLNNDIVPRIEQLYREERMGTEGEMIVEELYFEGIRSKYILQGSSSAPYIMFTGKAGTKNRIKQIGWYKRQERNKSGIYVTRSYPVYPSFVKIRYGSTNSPTSYVVYELIGYNMEATKAGNINYIPIYVAVNKKGYRYKGHVITEYGQYQGHMFNLMPIGVTSEDFLNGNIVNLINKSGNLNAEQKKQYTRTFGKNFRHIATLPSYTHLVISDMYNSTVVEQEDSSFEEESTIETTQGESINIYYGTGENADLSNFAERPFEFEGVNYRNVESAFLARKLDFSDFYHYPNFGGPNDVYFDMLEKFELTTGPEARKLGRQIIGLDQTGWDKHSSAIMKMMIKESFKQNPSALERLLATGNAELTHNQDDSKWKTEFPRILMEVREELRPGTNQSDQKPNPSEYINYSGAAPGADTVWAEIGKEFGIGKQRDFTPEDMDNPKLTAENRQEIENAYQQAVRDLGRRELNPNTYAGKLVRRDYLQAKAADAIFAIGTISNNNVNGGTGYAVAMAKRMGKPIHVFDYNQNQWFTWNGKTFVRESTPILTKKFAGIGTTDIAKTKWGKDNSKYVGEELEQRAIQAIRDVYETTFNSQRLIFDNTVTTAEEWSKKEGWSIKYYQDKVFPKINEAWQMEYEVADDQDVDPNFKGQMKYKYGNYKRSDVTADSTIEAIENGERTATTRFESDGHLDYWKKARVGDIIEFTDGATSIKVVVTKPLTKLISSDKSVQLSLFDGMSDQDRKDIQDQIDEHNKKCNR